jgi:hypothetical protein
MKTEKDLWLEMSIREIWTQSHFALIAYKNLLDKVNLNTDVAFSSIHSFLSHCALIARLLRSSYSTDTQASVASILNIGATSEIFNTKFRNSIEHYDEELKKWIKKKGTSVNILSYNIGPKGMIIGKNLIFISHYDPTNHVFTFVDEDFEISLLETVVKEIKERADDWVKTNTRLKA